jgi:nitrile hydratase subunit beta
MDGIHDLGGLSGFGRVEAEPDEPVFHARWEARTFALAALASLSGLSSVDASRHAMERIPPLDYLSLPYYGRWLRGLETRLLEAGVLEPGELEARLADRPFARRRPVPAMRRPATAGARRSRGREPRFRVGQRVRTRNAHPAGHTRLAGYVRTRRGVVAIVHPDAWVLPDTNAHGRGEHPEPVYSVRFEGRELWGDDAEPGAAVHFDLFESYLLADPEDSAR